MTDNEAKSVLFDMLGKGIYVKDTKENQAILVALRALDQEPCENAISRQAVRHILNHEVKMPIKVWKKLFELVDCLPPVTPQPKTGHWIKIVVNGQHKIQCNKCNYTEAEYATHIRNYCPNCGIEMEEE